MDPLMAGIEAPRMSAHRCKAGFLLYGQDALGTGERVCDRNLDLNMLSGTHAFDCLFGVYLRRGCENHGLQTGPRQGFLEIRRPVWSAVLLRSRFSCFSGPAMDADDFGILDALQSIQMFLGKRTLPNHDNLHVVSSASR